MVSITYVFCQRLICYRQCITDALVMHLNPALMRLNRLQFDMVGLYLLGCFVGFLLLSLNHMLYVIFLCYAVVVDVVFPGCLHFYFVLL